LRDANEIGGKRRVECFADARDHRHAPNDLVIFRNPVERAGADRLFLQLTQARSRTRIKRHEVFRIVAGK
jgi:hypothetical protein